MKREATKGALAWVVLGFPLLALGVSFAARDAIAQSAVTLGSTLDQAQPSDSLLPSGSFRLDGPAENSLLNETSSDSHGFTSGSTSLGLQIYGSGAGLAPRPAEYDAPPPAPLGSTLTRP